MKRTVSTLTFFVITAMLASKSNANMITNGSFESGLDGWSPSRFFDVMHFYGATDGNLALEFAFGDANGSYITQDITTEVGNTYFLSFDWKASHPGFQSMDVKIDGITILPVSGGYSGAYNTGLPFIHYEASFIATNSVTKFGFFDTSPSSFQKDQIIDNVSITQAVPEPSTIALFLFGLIGLMKNRRVRFLGKDRTTKVV